MFIVKVFGQALSGQAARAESRLLLRNRSDQGIHRHYSVEREIKVWHGLAALAADAVLGLYGFIFVFSFSYSR